MNEPAFYTGVGDKLAESPEIHQLLNGLSGTNLAQFKANIPSLLDRVKAAPNIDYKPLVPLASKADQLIAQFATKGAIRSKAEPVLESMFNQTRTNNAPSLTFNPAQQGALGEFFHKNPLALAATSWAVTNNPTPSNLLTQQ